MWKTVKLCDVCTIKTGKKDVNEGNSDGAYPFFTCAKEHTYSDVYSFDCEAILIAGNGAVGQTTYFKGKFEAYQRTYVLSDFQAVLPKLLLFMLQGRLMQHLSSMVLGNTIPYIKKGMLSDFEFSLPPLAEQQRIVAKLDAAFDEIDSAIEIACSKEAELSSFKSSALDNIFQKLSNETKMGQVFEFVRGPFGGSLKKNMFTEEGFAVYEQQHAIRNQCSDFRYYVPREKYDEMSRFRVRPNAILMSCSGTIGKTTIVPESFVEGIINQALLMLNPNSNVLSKFANFYMQSSHFSQQLLERVEGAAQKNVASVKVLKEILIPLPSVEEQNSLVASIENLLSEISHTQETAKTIQTNYTQLKSAILAQELQPPQSAEA